MLPYNKFCEKYNGQLTVFWNISNNPYVKNSCLNTLDSYYLPLDCIWVSELACLSHVCGITFWCFSRSCLLCISAFEHHRKQPLPASHISPSFLPGRWTSTCNMLHTALCIPEQSLLIRERNEKPQICAHPRTLLLLQIAATVIPVRLYRLVMGSLCLGWPWLGM